MGFFSRNKEAVGTGRGNDVPFETVRRSPRNSRKNAAADSRFDSGVPLDPAETTRTRARRRLIGAVALALAAIVFVPMLFDRTAAPPPDDITLQLPDRDTPFEGRRGVPDPGKGPLVPSTELPVMRSAGPASPSAAVPAAVSEPSPAPDSNAQATDKPAVVDPPRVEAAQPVSPPKLDKPAAVAKAPEKSAETSADPAKAVMTSTTNLARPTDDPRAIAALEGKSDTAATTSTSTGTTNGHGYAVQIAAYAAPEKARRLRDQLSASGLKSYVESVSTAAGLRTRVRLGPFASREAADRAREKLRTMKLDGSVVPL
jgi:DedD protein